MRLSISGLLIAGALFPAACTSDATSQATPASVKFPSAVPPTANALSDAAQLADDLIHNCQVEGRRTPGPAEGEPAIDFTLRDVDGTEYRLSDLLQEKPVVLIFGSFT